MPVHSCPRCLKEFSSPYHLQRHKERKKPCKLATALARRDDSVCPHCDRKFSTKGNMHAHVRNGKCPNVGAPVSSEVSDAGGPRVINNFNNTVNIITVNNINGPAMADPTQLRDFGHEDISHITPSAVEHMLRSIPPYVVTEDAGAEWVRRVLTSIWANEDTPGNHNVVQIRPRGPPLIVEDGKWRESSEDIVHGIMQGRAAELIARTPLHTPADNEVKHSVMQNIAMDRYRPLTRVTVGNSQAEFHTIFGRLPESGERWVPKALVRAPRILPLPSTAALMLGAPEQR